MSFNKKMWVMVGSLFVIISGSLFFLYQTQTRAQNDSVSTKNIEAIYSLKEDVVYETTSRSVSEKTEVKLNNYEQFAADIKKANEENTSTISIQFFGDIMLDRNVAKNMGKKGLDYLFEYFYGPEKGLYHHANLLVANLEGPFAPSRVPTTKSIAFRFDPSLASQLKKYEFDAVSLANNHTLDMGKQNVDFTRETLKKQNIGFFGYQTKENKDLTWIAEIPDKEDKIAFIGLNNTDHPLDMSKVSEAIIDGKQKARYVIVFMHWGVEYKRVSRDQERNLARLLIDKGADAVIGAHPHVVQEMELYKEKPIFYSLGNFIFDQYFSTETQEGISVGLILQDGKVKQISIFPFYAEKSQVRLMEGAREQNFFEWWNKNSRIDSKKFEKGKIIL